MFLPRIIYWYNFMAFYASWLYISTQIQLHELLASPLHMSHLVLICFFLLNGWSTSIFKVFSQVWRSLWGKCRLEDQVRFLFQSSLEEFCMSFRDLDPNKPASAMYRRICSLQILNFAKIYTLSSFFKIFFSFLNIALMWRRTYEKIIGLPVRKYFHKIHLFENLRDKLSFLLMSKEIDQKIKILKRVFSFIEEGLEVSINFLIDFSMVIFLIPNCYTS